MALENVVLSANQNDVEACLAERAANEADIPTRAAAESTSAALFSSVRCKDSEAIKLQRCKRRVRVHHRSKQFPHRGIGPRSHGRAH